MKKLLLVIIALSAGMYAQAQNITIGARGGLSIPNLSASGSESTPLSEGYSSRLGPGFAVFVEHGFSKLFSLQVAIEYSAQGGKKKGLQAMEVPAEMAPLLGPNPPEYLYADFESEAKFNYLMIPVLAKFGWNLGATSPFRVYVDAGPFVSFLLNAKQVTKGTSPIYLDENGQMAIPNPADPSTPFVQVLDAETDIKDRLNKVNVGFEANIGIAYKVSKSSSIFIEGGGNYGLVKVQKETRLGANNTGAGTVMIGYSYSF